MIIGHDAIRDTLRNSVIKDTLSHGHIISGADGIGKSIVAKELAIKILGKDIDRDYVDIINYRCTKKSIGVDDIRSINEEISKKPFEGDRKVVIIHNGDDITVQGQNAFLKTIEEPPKGVYIIILCENEENILDTIKSRCQRHKLNPLSEDEMRQYLNMRYGSIPDNRLKALLAFSEGIPGRADKYMNDKSFNNIRELTLKILMNINTRDIGIAVNYAKEITDKYRGFYDDVLELMLIYIRDIIVYKELGSERYILNQDKIEAIEKLALNVSFNKLNSIIKIIDDTRRSLDKNVNAAMTFEVMLMNMLEG